eukprot:CAMPEP_0178896952 /NCGR_PEP_ID=MMETSP0786-20121207/1472_1 /TAXON_ID=186022 /ORGANISM="Thalassionema frauenfeldii, Strain CCMP 1798" /LENGTH=276 /DNA_ID=CAMNT_0020567439 /DNA_START=70 /DNA_END=900 /DNA_ORIENTATION=-
MSKGIAAKILEEQRNLSLTDKARLHFPLRLHDLVTNTKSLGFDDVISWHPSGSKFMISSQKDFTARVLPTVFNQSKFSSFRRQLNAYGFDRESTDPTDSVTFAIFSHKKFRRGDLEACATITRRRGKEDSKPPLYSSSVAEKPEEHKNEALPTTVTSACSATDGEGQKELTNFLKLTDTAQNTILVHQQNPPLQRHPQIQAIDRSTLLKLEELQHIRRIRTLGAFSHPVRNLWSPSLSSLLPSASITQATTPRQAPIDIKNLDQALRLNGYKLVKR